MYVKADRCNNCLYRALCRHTFLNKYNCHMACGCHITNILNPYSNQTFLHICTKTQPAEIHTSCVNAKYVLDTYMPTKLGIYAKYLRLTGKSVYTYLCYIRSHCNQPYYSEHCTHISHASLKKYGCHTAHTCPTAQLLYCTYRPHISHIPQTSSL